MARILPPPPARGKRGLSARAPGMPPRDSVAGGIRRSPRVVTSAWGEAVVSSNIVGYNRIGQKNGLNLMAAPFVAVADGDQDIDINATMSSDSLKTGTTAMFWNGSNYDYVYYYDKDSEGGIYVDDSYETCLGPGWGDIDQVVLAKDMTRGEGFWIQSAGAATNVFSGQVSTNAVTLTLSNGLNLVGNPFPADIPLQNIKSDSLKTGTTAMFWNGSNYGYVYWYDADSEGGVYTDDSYETCLGPGWGDIDQIAIDATLKSLEGFWIQSAGAASATIEF